MISISTGKPFVVALRAEQPHYVTSPVSTVLIVGGVSNVVDDDANVSRSSTSTVLTEAVVQPELEKASTFESLDTGIATVSEFGVVSRVSNGTARIIAKSGRDIQRFDISVSESGGVTTDTLLSWVIGTVAKEATDNVESRINGLTPSPTTLNIYSARNDDAGTYTRNVLLWCADYSAALTGCSAWNSTQGERRAQTAITPRHVVGAAHYGMTIGETIRFVTNDGAVVNRTVTHTRVISGSDIQLSLLDSDIPASITPVSILPPNWDDYIRNIHLQIPCLIRNQYGEVGVFDVKSLSPIYALFTPNMPVSRSSWYRQLVTGDSGGPVMLMVSGVLVLVTTWTTATSGSSYHSVNWASEIATLDALAGISTGYTPAVIDLSPFTNFS